jgi:LysR family nod box-dependent transcriptional activator
MQFRGLDLNLLVSLDVLLRERSITRAGERLGLSQPAASGALARLREYFNDPLLVQVGRQLMPTPLAESLAGPVAELLQQIQATVTAKATFDAKTSDRRFSIMASDYAFTILMPAVLSRVEREAPHVTLQLRQLSPTWHEELGRGDLDFVIIPESFRLAAHPSLPLFADGFSCVVWEKNELVGSTLTLEQYLSLGHVVVTLSGVHEQSFDEWFLKKGGHARRAEVVAPTYAIVPTLVVGGHRLATIWTRLARMAAQHLPIRLVPLPVDIPPFQEVLQWPAHRDTDPGSHWLRETLREEAQRLPATP